LERQRGKGIKGKWAQRKEFQGRRNRGYESGSLQRSTNEAIQKTKETRLTIGGRGGFMSEQRALQPASDRVERRANTDESNVGKAFPKKKEKAKGDPGLKGRTGFLAEDK